MAIAVISPDTSVDTWGSVLRGPICLTHNGCRGGTGNSLWWPWRSSPATLAYWSAVAWTGTRRGRTRCWGPRRAIAAEKVEGLLGVKPQWTVSAFSGSPHTAMR